MASLILTLLFALTVVFGGLVGLIRGLNKAVIRIITLVLAIILTFVIAGPVTTSIVENIQIEGMTLSQLILNNLRSTEEMAIILDAAPLVQEAILVAPAFLLSIIVFPVVFFVLKFLTWILFLCVQKPLRKLIFKDNCNKEEAAEQSAGVRVGKRFAGMGIGIVTGVLIFGMIFTPIFGLLSVLPEKAFMDNALDTIVSQNTLAKEDAAAIQSAYAITDHPIILGYRLVGWNAAGRAYLDSVSKMEAAGHKTSLIREFDALMSTVYTAMDCGLVNALLSPEDPNAIFTFLADKDQVDALIEAMLQSEFLRAAVPELMAMAMETVADSMHVPADKEAVYENMMHDIALALKESGIDFAAIAAYEADNASRSGKGDSSGNLTTQEEYEEAIAELAKLTATISSILNKAMAGDNKIFADSIADYIVAEAKTQAAQNGQAALENFDTAGVIANLDAANIDAGEGDAAQLLEQLADSQKFETDVATIDTIVSAIRQSVAEAVADDEKAQQTAGTLASVVSDFAGAVASAMDENGDLDPTKLDFEKVASAVTSLQNSNLKDVGSTILDIVISGDLGNNSLLGNALSAVKDGYEKGEDIGGTISSAGALIGLGSAMNGDENGNVNQEAMVDSLTSLINNLNEFTIDLLPSILPLDTLTSMGIPEEQADAAFGVVETLLRELMNLKGADDYDSEVNAILAFYNLATNGIEDFTEEDIPMLLDYAMNSDAIFNTLVSISTSNPFGIQIDDADTRAELASAIEDYYAQSGKTQREHDIYTAIATLLGLEDEVALN